MNSPLSFLVFSVLFASAAVAQTPSRVSDVGPDEFGNYNAEFPAIAYNSTNDEYLAVWQGDDTQGAHVEDEYEIYGQRIDAQTGEEIGTNDFAISSTAAAGNRHFDALHPDIVYNPAENEYFVVWSADTNENGLANEEFEIYGQRLDGETGTALGSVIRISDMGPDGDADFDADYPAVALDSTSNRYLVVWHGDDNTSGLIDDDVEIFGQLVNASDGSLINSNFQISDTGGTDDPAFEIFYKAVHPAVAYDSSSNQFLVAYWSDGNSHVTVSNEEFEVFGRFVLPNGTPVGSDDFLVGDMGIFNLMLDYAGSPSVAANSSSGEFLVAWSGFHNTGSGIEGTSFSGHEIFGQLLDGSSRSEAGDDDFRISDMGGDGDDGFFAIHPAAAYDSQNQEYIVVWSSDGNTQDVVDGQFEIFMQRLDAADGSELGANDLRVSFMGASGETSYNADTPAVTIDSTRREAVVVWGGDTDSSYGGEEIFLDYLNLNHSSLLFTEFCFEWNGFLDMWNIAEFVNSSSSDRIIDSNLFNASGVLQSTNAYLAPSNRQQDVLVHEFSGWSADAYGKVCSNYSGSAGDISGRSVFYRPNSSGYDFAFSAPFANTARGSQFVSFNTYQPSLNPNDAGNLAANWIQVTNAEDSAQSGAVVFYGQDGSRLGIEIVSLSAGERKDVSAHQFGANLVGLAAWVPDNAHSHAQFRNVRYYYDNSGSTNSFDSAYQLSAAETNSAQVWLPVDTREGSSIIEVVNTTTRTLSFTATIYSADGLRAAEIEEELEALASTHIIVDDYLSSALGIAKIDKTGSASMLATVMQYGRNASAGIDYVYGISSLEPLGSSLEGSYNTFLGQGCSLLVGNTASSAQTITLSMTRYDGTSVVSGAAIDIAANGIADIDICASAESDTYGTVRITPATADSIVAVVVRKGANDDYRFPTVVH